MEAETFHLPSGKWNIGPYWTIEMKVNESRENNLKKKELSDVSMPTVERVPNIFNAFSCRSLTLHQSLKVVSARFVLI